MIDSLYSNLRTVFLMTWPTLFISLVVLISIRVVYLIRNKKEFVFYREVMLLLFAMYILCLFQVVTAQDINLLNGNNFIPFREIFRYKIGSKYFVKNIIGNVMMFMPYGFFACRYGSKNNYKLAIFLVLLASISIECTQLAIGRIFDIDDIILNFIGGILGYFIYNTLDRILEYLPKFFQSKAFLNTLSSIMLICFSLLVYKIIA